jgi:hypothetical protein
MNYAALLALLAALAFAAPFLVNLASLLGIPRALGIVTTLAGALFLLGWLLVRERVERQQRLEARIATLHSRRSRTPGDPESYFLAGEHLGDLLVQVGRPREALRVFEAYNRLLENAAERENERRVTEGVIASLRRELAERQEEEREGV